MIISKVQKHKMCTFANSEDPDDIPHNVVFHQSLHCLLRQIDLRRKKYKICLEIITCDPSIYIMDHLDLTLWEIPFNA